MVKRCGECSVIIDSNTLCDKCLARAKASTISLVKTFDTPVIHVVPRPKDFLEVADKIMKEQAPVLKKLAESEAQDKLVEQEQFRLKPTNNAIPSKGLKFDGGKPDLSILPIEALESMAAAFTYGAKKYARNNYKQGIEVNRTMAASLRHIYAFLNKEDRDVESGLSHLSHALACIAMTVYNLKHNPKMDDR